MVIVRHISSFRFLQRFLALFILILAVVSCSKDPIRPVDPTSPVDPPVIPDTVHNGMYVINEGNFNHGNASVTFIDFDDTIVEQDLFSRVNDRPLGDVAEAMKVFNNKGYIVVNNSNRVEVVSLPDFKSVKSIDGFNSPRSIEFIDSNKAYVTNLLKDISVVDLTTMTVTKSIATPNWTEGMIRYKNYVFVTCIGKYSQPNSERIAKLYVIDSKEDRIIDSIATGKEPLGIVIDMREKIWLLCTGGYDNYEAPSIIRINPELRLVEKIFHFPDAKEVPSRLCINKGGDTLYFLKSGIYQMPVASSAIPATPLIQSNGHLFYGLDICPTNGNIFVSDAVDFVQYGFVYRYHQVTASQIMKYPAGRIPGYFCFSTTKVSK